MVLVPCWPLSVRFTDTLSPARTGIVDGSGCKIRLASQYE